MADYICKQSSKARGRLRRAFKGGYLSLIAGGCIITVFVLFALFPSAFAPYSPKQSFASWQGASLAHLLGTNDLGYDILSELIYATRATLAVGLSAAVISLAIGTTVGLAAGYAAGALGGALNGLINFFLLVPMLPLAIVLAAYLGGGRQNVLIIVALLGWCATARAVRAKTIQLKGTPFVEALRGIGCSRSRILFCHILPNLREVVFTKYVMSVAACIMLEASLSFLGLGGEVNVTWGLMINYAYKLGAIPLRAYGWLFAPGACIMLLSLAFYLINNFIEIKIKGVKSSGSYLD